MSTKRERETSLKAEEPSIKRKVISFKIRVPPTPFKAKSFNKTSESPAWAAPWTSLETSPWTTPPTTTTTTTSAPSGVPVWQETEFSEQNVIRPWIKEIEKEVTAFLKLARLEDDIRRSGTSTNQVHKLTDQDDTPINDQYQDNLDTSTSDPEGTDTEESEPTSSKDLIKQGPRTTAMITLAAAALINNVPGTGAQLHHEEEADVTHKQITKFNNPPAPDTTASTDWHLLEFSLAITLTIIFGAIIYKIVKWARVRHHRRLMEVAMTDQERMRRQFNKVLEARSEAREQEDEDGYQIPMKAINLHNGKYESNMISGMNLPYINIRIGNRPGQGIIVKAIKDTGCTHTMMTSKLFDHIPQTTAKIKRYQPDGSELYTASDQPIKIHYYAKIFITFMGQNESTHCFSHIVGIVKGLSDDFYLGNDILGGESIICEDQQFIYMTKNPEQKRQLLILPSTCFIKIPKLTTANLLNGPPIVLNLLETEPFNKADHRTIEEQERNTDSSSDNEKENIPPRKKKKRRAQDLGEGTSRGRPEDRDDDEDPPQQRQTLRVQALAGRREELELDSNGYLLPVPSARRVPPVQYSNLHHPYFMESQERSSSPSLL